MKPIFAVLAALALLLAGCQGTLTLPALPTPSPTLTATLVPTPTPTPTREDEGSIPFETIAIGDLKGTPPVGGEPEIVTHFGPQSVDELNDLVDKGPFIFLVTSPEEVALFERWLLPESRAAITSVDYQKYAVIAFFVGLRGGCCDGYIERIAASEDQTLTVYAFLRNRSSGTDDLTFPGHIVKLQRQDVPFPLSADTQVTLEVNE